MTESNVSRNVAVYVVGKGEILNTIGGSSSFIIDNTPEGCAVIDAQIGINEHLYMVDETTMAIVSRPVLGFELPETLLLGSILELPAPLGTKVFVDGELKGEADINGIEIEFASPGRYSVEITLWPFVPLRKRIRID